MTREHVLQILRQHEPELKAAGLLHLRLFGSVARGEANSASDVDLLAEFDRSKMLTLVTIGSLERRLADLLNAPVELLSETWMREPVSKQALQEAIIAF